MSDEKAAEEYLDTKANSDNFDVQKAFLAGCQRVRQGQREMLMRLLAFRSIHSSCEKIVDEFLAEEAKRDEQ